jgi:hypothetical protein
MRMNQRTWRRQAWSRGSGHRLERVNRVRNHWVAHSYGLVGQTLVL